MIMVQTVSENKKGDASICFEYRDQKRFFNTTKYITLRLKAAGLGEIELFSEDTFDLKDRYLSYRRSMAEGTNDYGRQITALWLE